MLDNYIVKLRLFIPAGAATAIPPLGPILGQYGVNTVQFCKEFNDLTANLPAFFEGDAFGSSGFLLVVNIFIREDRTFFFSIEKPPVSFLLRILTGLQKGNPQIVVATLSLRDLLFLARFKFPAMRLYSASMIIRGTARSMGIKIIL